MSNRRNIHEIDQKKYFDLGIQLLYCRSFPRTHQKTLSGTLFPDSRKSWNPNHFKCFWGDRSEMQSNQWFCIVFVRYGFFVTSIPNGPTNISVCHVIWRFGRPLARPLYPTLHFREAIQTQTADDRPKFGRNAMRGGLRNFPALPSSDFICSLKESWSPNSGTRNPRKRGVDMRRASGTSSTASIRTASLKDSLRITSRISSLCMIPLRNP